MWRIFQLTQFSWPKSCIFLFSTNFIFFQSKSILQNYHFQILFAVHTHCPSSLNLLLSSWIFAKSYLFSKTVQEIFYDGHTTSHSINFNEVQHEHEQFEHDHAFWATILAAKGWWWRSESLWWLVLNIPDATSRIGLLSQDVVLNTDDVQTNNYLYIPFLVKTCKENQQSSASNCRTHRVSSLLGLFPLLPSFLNFNVIFSSPLLGHGK